MIPADGMARLGTETAFEVLAKANALAAQGRDIINLGIGQPDFKTPDHIVEACVKALRDGHHGYTDAQGIPPLREAVAEYLERYNKVKVDPAQVVIVPGGKVTMWFAILMFGQPGVEILYPNPGFPIYESAINFTGAKAIPIDLHEENGFSFSAAEVLAKLTPRTRLIILNTPANPTGGAVPKAELDALAAGLADRPDIAILSDEIYSRITYDGHAHTSLLSYPEIADRVILLDGWSKTFAMTGWRMGFAVWPKPLVEGAVRLAVNSHSCVNAPAQYAGIAALNGPQDAVDTMVAAFTERRRVIVDRLNGLPGMRCVDPGGAFYAFPNITGTGLSSMELQTRLLDDAGIATVSGTAFGSYGEGYLRLSYAASLPDIERAMDRIAELLGQIGANSSQMAPTA